MTRTTFTRASLNGASATRDETPSALGALGLVTIADDTTATGGAAVFTADSAHAWTAQGGAAIDPRTGRPLRAAPWASRRPTNITELVHYLRGYLAGYNPGTLAGHWNALNAAQREALATRREAVTAVLTLWGWTIATNDGE